MVPDFTRFLRISQKPLSFFGRNKKSYIFAAPFEEQAGIAQLVEHDLAKVGVAGSSPVSRSFFLHLYQVLLILGPDGGIGRRAGLKIQ